LVHFDYLHSLTQTARRATSSQYSNLFCVSGEITASEIEFNYITKRFRCVYLSAF